MFNKLFYYLINWDEVKKLIMSTWNYIELVYESITVIIIIIIIIIIIFNDVK